MPPSHTDGFTTPPKRWPLVTACVAGTVVVVLAVVGVVALVTGGSSSTHKAALLGPSSAGVPVTSSPAAPATTAGSPAAVASSPAGPLALPLPTGNDEGVPVGYPATTGGAVSAAYHFEQAIGSTLDPDRAAVIGRIITAPSFPNAPDAFAKGTAATRAQLGLSSFPNGENKGVSVTLTPSDYSVEDVSSTSVSVRLLSRVAIDDPIDASQSTNTVSVNEVQMVLVGSDWRVAKDVEMSDAERKRLAVDPANTAAVDALGWVAINAD